MGEWVIPSACEGYNVSVTFSIDYVLPSYDLQHVKTSRYSLLIRLVFPFLFYCFYMYKFETFFISEIYRICLAMCEGNDHLSTCTDAGPSRQGRYTQTRENEQWIRKSLARSICLGS